MLWIYVIAERTQPKLHLFLWENQCRVMRFLQKHIKCDRTELEKSL